MRKGWSNLLIFADETWRRGEDVLHKWVTGAKSDNQSRGYQKLSSLCHAAASKRRDMQQGARSARRQSVCSIYAILGLFFYFSSCPVCSDLCTEISEPQTLYGDKQENLGEKRWRCWLRNKRSVKRILGIHGYPVLVHLLSFLLFSLK